MGRSQEMNSVVRSYEAQILHESSKMTNLPACWQSPDSVDAWRHERMLAKTLPLLHAYPGASWLTIGDGRYGSDAGFLKRHGANAVASSITDATLSEAKERGFIDDYRIENAEHLSLNDDAFDFVLCKESCHHCPRPPIAIYEMFRVARHAVVLIEPIEEGSRLLDWGKRFAKKLLGRPEIAFEPSGNFLYRLHPSELIKMLAAINQECLAVFRMNDFYHRRLAQGKLHGSPQGWMTKGGVIAQNALCRVGLMNWGLGVFVLIKGHPDPAIKAAVLSAGFQVESLPQNPYLRCSDH